MIEQQQKTSFVARIWLERANKTRRIWRGRIQHVQGNTEAYFQNLEEMSDFMEQVAGVPGPATTGEAVRQGKDVAGKPKD